jgi:hypothetical protein
MATLVPGCWLRHATSGGAGRWASTIVLLHTYLHSLILVSLRLATPRGVLKGCIKCQSGYDIFPRYPIVRGRSLSVQMHPGRQNRGGGTG